MTTPDSAHTTRAPRWARGLILILPAIWLGIIIGISLIEAPLKFTAPGITIPLGLGIGRRVFLAMNMTEVVIGILLIIALVAVRKAPTPGKVVTLPLILSMVVLALKTAVIRPMLAGHTDAVLAGTSDGGSMAHYLYILADGALIIFLLWAIVAGIRRLLPKIES